jgi:hypothetical protein
VFCGDAGTVHGHAACHLLGGQGAEQNLDFSSSRFLSFGEKAGTNPQMKNRCPYILMIYYHLLDLRNLRDLWIASRS